MVGYISQDPESCSQSALPALRDSGITKYAAVSGALTAAVVNESGVTADLPAVAVSHALSAAERPSLDPQQPA